MNVASEARGDLALIRAALLFSFKYASAREYICSIVKKLEKGKSKA